MAGILINGVLSGGPVSSKQTDTFGFSVNLLAKTQPADPPPTMM
jgi:hypothetical protein